MGGLCSWPSGTRCCTRVCRKCPHPLIPSPEEGGGGEDAEKRPVRGVAHAQAVFQPLFPSRAGMHYRTDSQGDAVDPVGVVVHPGQVGLLQPLDPERQPPTCLPYSLRSQSSQSVT